MKFRADMAVGNFARITFTKHRDIAVVGEGLAVRWRHSLGDRLRP